MASTALKAREEKEKWLLRPLEWAFHVAFYSLIFSVMIWTDSKVTTITHEVIAYFALAALAIVTGLLFWAMKRILNTARGRD